MKYVRYANVSGDTKDVPDAEIFTVYKEDHSWAFGMRIRGMFTFTGFRKENVDKDEVSRAWRQIMFCKKYGWSYLGKKRMNDETFEFEPEFMCMYCRGTGFDTSKPCICRNKKIEDMFVRTTKGGIYLPY